MNETNGKDYINLTEDEKEEFRGTYGNHPLADYIDWKEYYNSQNGNALDFVKCLAKYKDENENDVYVLDKMIVAENDYLLVFVCGENAFYKVPSSEIEDFDE